MTEPAVAGNNMKKGLKKYLAVIIIEKYSLAGVASGG